MEINETQTEISQKYLVSLHINNCCTEIRNEILDQVWPIDFKTWWIEFDEADYLLLKSEQNREFLQNKVETKNKLNKTHEFFFWDKKLYSNISSIRNLKNMELRSVSKTCSWLLKLDPQEVARYLDNFTCTQIQKSMLEIVFPNIETFNSKKDKLKYPFVQHYLQEKIDEYRGNDGFAYIFDSRPHFWNDGINWDLAIVILVKETLQVEEILPCLKKDTCESNSTQTLELNDEIMCRQLHLLMRRMPDNSFMHINGTHRISNDRCVLKGNLRFSWVFLNPMFHLIETYLDEYRDQIYSGSVAQKAIYNIIMSIHNEKNKFLYISNCDLDSMNGIMCIKPTTKVHKINLDYFDFEFLPKMQTNSFLQMLRKFSLSSPTLSFYFNSLNYTVAAMFLDQINAHYFEFDNLHHLEQITRAKFTKIKGLNCFKKQKFTCFK